MRKAEKFSLRLEPALLAQVDAYAAPRGLFRAEAMRELIRMALDLLNARPGKPPGR